MESHIHEITVYAYDLTNAMHLAIDEAKRRADDNSDWNKHITWVVDEIAFKGMHLNINDPNTPTEWSFDFVAKYRKV